EDVATACGACRHQRVAEMAEVRELAQVREAEEARHQVDALGPVLPAHLTSMTGHRQRMPTSWRSQGMRTCADTAAVLTSKHGPRQTSRRRGRCSHVGLEGGEMSRLFRVVLVPHDFSPPATRALRIAAQLAAGEKGRLLVLHAIAPVYPIAGLPPVGAAGAWLPPPIPGAGLVAHERRRLEALVARSLSRRRVRADW